MPVVRLLIGIVVVLGLTWVLFMAALILFKPKGINFAEAKRLVPHIVRLLRALAGDRDLPPSVRRRLTCCWRTSPRLSTWSRTSSLLGQYAAATPQSLSAPPDR